MWHAPSHNYTPALLVWSWCICTRTRAQAGPTRSAGSCQRKGQPKPMYARPEFEQQHQSLSPQGGCLISPDAPNKSAWRLSYLVFERPEQLQKRIWTFVRKQIELATSVLFHKITGHAESHKMSWRVILLPSSQEPPEINPTEILVLHKGTSTLVQNQCICCQRFLGIM